MKRQHFEKKIPMKRTAALEELLGMADEITSLSEGLAAWLEDENAMGRPMDLRRVDESMMEMDAILTQYKKNRDSRAYINE